MELTLRPMSTAQVLDRTFQLYRRNFLLFAGIASLPPALFLVAQAVGLAGQLASPSGVTSPPISVSGTNPFTPDRIGALIGFLVLGLFIYLIGYALANGATIYAVSRVHLGNTTTIGESYRSIGRFVLSLVAIVVIIFLFAFFLFLAAYLTGALVFGLLAVLLAAAAGGLGTIIALVLGVPAIVAIIILALRLACRLGLAVPSCVLEKLGPIKSIKRSWSLAKGGTGRILLIYFLAAVIGFALSLALSMPNYIAMGVMGVLSGKLSWPFQVWALLATFLAGTIAGPIGTIAISLVYYDQRVRKEAFDLQLMMEAIGHPMPPQAATSASIG